MDIDYLKSLEKTATKLAHFTAYLIELESVPDMIPPSGFESREEYRLHLGNMIGSYRIQLGMVYNSIAEWQNI